MKMPSAITVVSKIAALSLTSAGSRREFERDRPQPQAVQALLDFVREWGQAKTQG